MLRCVLLAATAVVAFALRSNAPIYTTTVGDFDVTVLSDGVRRKGKAESLVPDVPQAAVVKAAASHFQDPHNILRHYNPLYLDTGDHKVLFDTGSGTTLGRNLGHLLDNMREAGIEAEDVTNVVLSHAHIDHVGGVLDDQGDLAFPNANYSMSEKEFEYWSEAMADTSDDVRQLGLDVVKRAFDELEDKLSFFQFGEEIVPGVTALDMAGHTPGHTGFLIRSEGEEFLYGADLIIVDFLNVEHPEWIMDFDMDAETSISTRFKLFEELAANGTRGSYYHVGFPGIGHIYLDGRGFGFRESKYEF
ncbi:hypothetical protein BSKO_04504 [Bryopsis sp. KO-2023]|nr:hypothetical protein BSKO_04504 [Bryopsis sp. KO-2023]